MKKRILGGFLVFALGIILLIGCTSKGKEKLDSEVVAKEFLQKYYTGSEETFITYGLPEEAEEAKSKLMEYYGNFITEKAIDDLFANRLLDDVKSICEKEDGEAVCQEIKLEKHGADNGQESYNYECIFTVTGKEYLATGQIALIEDENWKVDNFFPIEIEHLVEES